MAKHFPGQDDISQSSNPPHARLTCEFAGSSLCRAMVDALPDPVYLLDDAGHFLESNQACRAFPGLAAHGGSLAQLWDVSPGFVTLDDAPLALTDHPAILSLQTGQTIADHVLGWGDGDEHIWFSITATPIPLRDDRQGVMVTHRDVSAVISMRHSLEQSETRFRDFAESAGDWLWETDAEGRITYCSSGHISDVFGAVDFLIGKNRLDLAVRSPGDEAIWAQYQDDIAQRRPLREFVYRVQDKDGQFRWMRINGKAVVDAKGTFLGYRGIGGDVTELRKSQLEARANEKKFRAIFDRTFQFIGLLDCNGVLLEANRRALDIVGANPADVCGKPFWETPWWNASPTDRLRLKAGVALASQGQFVRFETTHPTPDGLVTVDFSLSPWFDENGKVVWIIPEGRDISERKRHELDLQNATAMAEAANQSKSHFLATMSHELRTPLNAILGYSEMVLEESLGPLDNPNYKEYLTYIHEAGTRLLTVVQDILDISRIETGTMDMEIDRVQLDDLAQKVSDLIAHHADQKRLSLDIEVRPKQAELMADRRRLTQALLNLMLNAVKFTQPGGRIGLIAEQAAGGTRFTVWDTGVGIADEHLRKIWEPFGQVESAWARSTGGSGLGLTLVRHLVEAQGGTIAVDSQPGQGSRFTVSFPAAASA